MAKDFTLEDIGKLINDAVLGSETRLKEYVDDRFNWLATQTIEGFERVNDALNLFKLEVRREFRQVNNRINSLERNTEARISIAEDDIRQLQKDVL